MGIGTGLGVAGIASAGIGAAGSLAAAGTQAGAANNAAGLQYQSGQNALGFQQEVFNQQQANEAPFIGAGQGAVTQLSNLLGVTPNNPTLVNQGAQLPTGLPGAPSGVANQGTTTPSNGVMRGNPILQQGANANSSASPQNGFPSTNENIGGINYNLPTGGGNQTGALTQPWDQQFQAPTAASAAQTPGYQFALQQGQQALQNSAAAQGNVLSGGTLKALDQYSQGLADTNYQNVYNNALTQYQQAYNQFQQNQGNTFNRLSALAGGGQTAVGQLGQQGTAAANSASNTLLGTANAVGQNINNAGAANASGYAGVSNALTGGIGSLSNSLLLSQLLGNQNPTASATTAGAGGSDIYY